MFKKKNFFSGYSSNSKKTLKAFKLLKKDIENSNIPVLDSYKKDYPMDKLQVELDNWNQLEKRNHKMFSTMYQFWVKKESY